MSDNIAPTRQRSCTELGCEDDKYLVDIFSYVQPGHHGHDDSLKQLFLYITREEKKTRKAFLQVFINNGGWSLTAFH